MENVNLMDSGGLLEKETLPMISRAKEMGESNSFAKLIVDAETDPILGASIHGVGRDEIINRFAASIRSGIQCQEYRRVVLVHHEVSELMPWILDRIKETRMKA